MKTHIIAALDDMIAKVGASTNPDPRLVLADLQRVAMLTKLADLSNATLRDLYVNYVMAGDDEGKTKALDNLTTYVAAGMDFVGNLFGQMGNTKGQSGVASIRDDWMRLTS